MILMSVKKNKRKTFFIVTLFFLIVTLFVYFISLFLLEGSIFAVVIALAFSIITTWVSYYNSDKIVLKLNGARKATKEEHLQLKMLLEGLCIAANLPEPQLYVLDDTALNAFATGRNPEHSVICVTTGLINSLDKYELEAVLAHELSHIKNYDILLQSVVIVMVGFVVILSDYFLRYMRVSKRNSDSDSKANGIIMLIGIIFIALAPLFAQLVKFALSRNREYLADAKAVEFTRNKDGMVNALTKLTTDTEALECANKSSESLYIVTPFKNQKKKNNLWSTHPTLESRIDRIKAIQ